MFQLVRRNTEENKTVHWKITALWGGKKVELLETERAVTPFGGLVVFFEFLRRIGYCEAVREHLPFSFRSPNAIDPVKTFTAFLLSVVAGADRSRLGLLGWGRSKFPAIYLISAEKEKRVAES